MHRERDLLAGRLAGEPPEEVARVLRLQFDRIEQLEHAIEVCLPLLIDLPAQIKLLAEHYGYHTKMHSQLVTSSIAVQGVVKALYNEIAPERRLKFSVAEEEETK